MRQEASASIEHPAHAFKSIAAQVSCIVSGLRWIRFRYLSFNSLRSRGGHGLPRSSIPDLGARPPYQACPRPAVKFVLTNASFHCHAFGFADRHHLFCVRARQLATAGQSTALADGGEILKLAHCPTCSSLPSRLYLLCR